MAKQAVYGVSGDEQRGDERPAEQLTETPRVVFVQAPVILGEILGREGEGWVTRLGSAERILHADQCVDPLLLEDAMSRGARVIVDQSDEPLIVGVVATQRTIVVDQEGAVNAEVERFELSARREVLLKTPGAFIRAKRAEIEVYGNKVLTRGREIAKILAAMIELN